MIGAVKNLVRTMIQNTGALSARYHRQHSYSQEGEDRVLDRIFGFCDPGFYVDVGAHDPHRFSNTYLFYRRGWRGINIDAMPGSMEKFNRMRPRDVNLEIGIGAKSGVAKFYVFNEPALNTFDPEVAKTHTTPDWRIERVIDVPIEPLAAVLDRYIEAGTQIEFLSVDVEGLDLTVLQSNDWSKYRPKVVLIESLKKDLTSIDEQEIVKFMKKQKYKPYAKTVNTFFFLQDELN